MPRPTARPSGWLAPIPTSGWCGSSGTGVSARPPMPASPRLAAVSSSCSTTTPRSPRAGSRPAWRLSPIPPSRRSRRWSSSGPTPAASIRRATHTPWPAGRPNEGTASPRASLPARPVEEVFGASGSSAFYRSAALRRAGGFDPLLGSYYEDVDLAFRLRWAGYRCVFAPRSVIYHDVSATYDHGSPALQRRMARNAEIVFWANLPPGLLALAIVPHLAFVSLQAAWRLARGRLRPFLLGQVRCTPRMARDQGPAQAPRRAGPQGRGTATLRPGHWIASGRAQPPEQATYATATAAENSDVLLLGSVAVAVMFSPAGKKPDVVKLIVALPLLLVVTSRNPGKSHPGSFRPGWRRTRFGRWCWARR